MHILLVDDDEDDRMFFEDALEDLDFDTSFEYAANGLEALEKLTARKGKLPDIMFLDLNMPLISGRECLERIRKDHRLKDLRIIIYSTSFDLTTKDLLREMGANRYLRKPGAYNELKQSIANAIKSLEQNKTWPVPEDKFVIHT